MEPIHYLDFDLKISKTDVDYRAEVLHSPGGEGRVEFHLPFEPMALESLLLRMTRLRCKVRRVDSPELAAVRQLGGGLYPANQPPYPGERETCAFVHQNCGQNIIITHCEIESCRILLETHKMSALFDDIFSSEQGYPRKPAPQMILAALSKYNLDPTETLMAGERIIDIQAGQAAGIQTCLIG